MAATVLIVDDDSNIRTTLETLLRTVLEAEVASAASAREALEWLASHAAQLVITDLCMPGMSGAALIQELRRVGNPAPVIIVSGHLRSFEQETLWREQGVAAVLQKPFSMQELIDAVSPHLGSGS
jgi:DNA-binding NtrC family response regulator